MAQQSNAAPAFVTKVTPEPEQTEPIEDKTDNEWEPQSLEEALLGE